jgi:uncharacterized membrane protein YoaK (UPF0700 family)
MTSETPVQAEERLAAACALSLVGGFTDVYSYLCRGHVFANAVTGNMVLLGLDAATLDWAGCLRYLLAIASYGCGIFVADAIHARLESRRLVTWHQIILLIEIALLTLVVFLPCGVCDFAVNAVIAFVCALQVQTFRRVRGLPFASTMCTGNLRSGTDALFNGLRGTDANGLRKARHYLLVIALFILGATLGAFLLNAVGRFSFLLAPALLAVVLALLTTKRQYVRLRRLLKRRHHKAHISA